MEKSFFEKLKKGMDIEKSPSVEEPSIVLATTKTIPDKKSDGKRKKKDKKEGEVTEKKKKIKVEKEPIGVKVITDEKENPPADEGKKWFESEGQLTVDVYQTDKEIVIQSAIAGIEPDDLDIIIENDMVAIRGNRKKLFEEKKRNYFYQECYWGQFSREIILPEEVDNSRAQATMKKGILTIRIPKIESKKKRKIGVINNDEE